MRILYVKAQNDFDALNFEEKYVGNDITSLIERIESGEQLIIDDEALDVEVLEFDEIDPRFIEFIKYDMFDYDQSKHTNIYLEGTIL